MNQASNNKIKVLINEHNEKIVDLESQIVELNKSIDAQKRIIDEISEEPPDGINDSKEDFLNSEIISSIMKIKNKVKILEDKAFYSDSLYFELINEIVRVENSIHELSGSDILNSNTNSIKLTNEEFTSKYIDYLSMYQKGDLSNSMAGFNNLLELNNAHDLSDNCQYWIGEILYGKKKYKESESEFLKVFNFPGTNKADDAYYKLGLCRLNMDDNDGAIHFFNELLEKFPNSEYIKKTKTQIKKISKG